jgi:hypothetical protein
LPFLPALQRFPLPFMPKRKIDQGPFQKNELQ